MNNAECSEDIGMWTREGEGGWVGLGAGWQDRRFMRHRQYRVLGLGVIGNSGLVNCRRRTIFTE